jgi:hypothetical protein
MTGLVSKAPTLTGYNSSLASGSALTSSAKHRGPSR